MSSPANLPTNTFCRFVPTNTQADDELLKQSQSSNFFSNNKNKGKEDFDDAYEKATKASTSAKSTKARGRNRGKSKFRSSNSISSAPIKSSSSSSSAAATQKPVTTFTTPIVVQPLSNERTSQGPPASTHNRQQQANSFRSSTLTPIQSTSALPQQPRKIDETFFDVPKANPKTTAKTQSKQQQQQNFANHQPAAPAIAAPAQNPFGFFGAIPQRVIIPSQLSPEQRLALQQSNGKSLVLSTTPPSAATSASHASTTQTYTPQHNTQHRPNQIQQQKASAQPKDFANLPQKFNFKTQKYEPVIEPLNPTTQFYNPKYETKGTEPPPYNHVGFDTTRDTLKQHNRTASISQQQQQRHHESHNEPTTFNPQQYYQSEHSQFQTLTPRGFSLAAKQQQPQITPQQQQQTKSTTTTTAAQQKITSRAESVRSHKKFSTLVPKDQYYPTTFKPGNGAFNKKAVEANKFDKTQTQQQNKVQAQQFTASSTQAPVTQSLNTSPFPHFHLPVNPHFQQINSFDQQQTTRLTNIYSTSSSPRPLAEDEEDDGQYRPELYEKDFYRNKIKTTKITAAPLKNSVHQSSTLKPQQHQQQQPNGFAGDDDELFKTAHSQNIFASGNQLRAEKEREKTLSKVPDFTQFTEKSSPRPFSKPTPPAAAPVTPKKVVTPPKKKLEKLSVGGEKDVSYDYQYYDTDTNLSDYSELGAAIEDFGKTVKKNSKKN